MKVSVITPTRLAPDRLPWLVTLHAQVMAEDLAVEHVIVVDGAGPHGVPSELSDAIIVAPGGRLGAAAARNFGLLVASGDVITSADDDDELPEGSLAVRARALEAASSRGVRWVAGDTVAFDDASGTQTRWKYDTPYGWCRPGLTLEVCPDPAGRVPLGPTTMMVDAVLLRQLGGWMALPQGEDLGMMMAVSCSAPGLMLDEIVYRYRFHPGQWTAQADFNVLEALARQAAWDRGRACLLEAVRNP